MTIASAYGCERIDDEDIEMCEATRNEFSGCTDCIADGVCGYHFDVIWMCADDY